MLRVKGIEYLSVPEFLSRGVWSLDELIERLYKIKSRSWNFLVQRYLRNGMEDSRVRELLKDQFSSRIELTAKLQYIACAEGVGPFGYISPLVVQARDTPEAPWHQNGLFDYYDLLTGEGFNTTHDPEGNVVVCPEIGVLAVLPHRGDFVCPELYDRDRIKKERLTEMGCNLVRFTLLKSWEHGEDKRICAYTLENTVGFHMKMHAKMMGDLRGAGPGGKRRALMYYKPHVVLRQIRKLAWQQSREDRGGSTRKELKRLQAALAAYDKIVRSRARSRSRPAESGCQERELRKVC